MTPEAAAPMTTNWAVVSSMADALIPTRLGSLNTTSMKPRSFSTSTSMVVPLNGEASDAVGARSAEVGVGIVAPTPKMAKPLTLRSWSWKPRPPPIEKRAAPLRLKTSWVPPFASSGMRIATFASGMSTSMRPVGARVKRTAPVIVKISAALMVSSVPSTMLPAASKPTSKISIFAVELYRTWIVLITVSPSSSMNPSPSLSIPSLSGSGAPGRVGRVMVSSIARPVLLMRTATVPVTVSPSRPISETRPKAKMAKVLFVPVTNLTTPSVPPLTSTPMASGLRSPLASRNGPTPRKISTLRAPIRVLLASVWMVKSPLSEKNGSNEIEALRIASSTMFFSASLRNSMRMLWPSSTTTSLMVWPVVLIRSTTSPSALKNSEPVVETLMLITPATPVGLKMKAPRPSLKSTPSTVALTSVAEMRTTLGAAGSLSVNCSNWKLPVSEKTLKPAGWILTVRPRAAIRM